MATDVAPKIPLEPVESSTIAALGVDAGTETLAVQFKAGSVYHYAPVTIGQALALYAAESKGRHYSSEIKGKIAGQKMTGHCPSCKAVHGWIGETCEECGAATVVEDVRGIR